MPSVLKIGKKWRAQVRRKGSKPITQTFATKAEATDWARQIEADLVAGRGVESRTSASVAELIEAYKQLREESGREVRRVSSERYMLANLHEGLGEIDARALSTGDLVEWAQSRRRDGAGPSTVNMELSKLGTVLRHAGAVRSMRLPDIVGEARVTLAHLGLIGPGGRRKRRPTSDELKRLVEWFAVQPGAVMPRIPDLLRVSIAVGLRRGELFRIRWDDLDVERRAVLVRDRKHPRAKKGNDHWVPLLGEAWQVVQRQPRSDERIFPYSAQTISKYFKAGCDALKIVDLRWHDMRHEAASALIEAGWDPFSVRAVTGHGVTAEDRQLGRYVQADVVALHERPIPRRKV